MKKFRVLIVISICIVVYLFVKYLTRSERYKHDLDSKNYTSTIVIAADKLGQMRDTSAIKLLLTHILDPRMSTNLFHKGISVNYQKLLALKEISGVSMGREIMRWEIDTPAVYFYLDWAFKNHFIKNKSEIDLDYY